MAKLSAQPRGVVASLGRRRFAAIDDVVEPFAADRRSVMWFCIGYSQAHCMRFPVIIFCALPLMLPCFVFGQAISAEPAEERVRTFVYKQTLQRDLELIVNFPLEWSQSDRRSAIVFYFGGGWAFSALEHFERQAEYFASRGMVSVRPDFRVKLRDGTTPAESVEDAKSAIRWIRAHADLLGIDPQRIVASGGSSGGHLAACTAQCSGPEDAGEDFSISSEPNALILFNPLLQYAGLREVEQTYPVESEELGRQISPVLHINVGDPPALLLFGTEDVLLKSASTYVEKSKALGNRIEMYLAEGEDHAFFKESPWYEHTVVEADSFLVSLSYLDRIRVSEQP